MLATTFWSDLREAPHVHDFYRTLRWIDARARATPMLGRATRPQDEPVRMRQAATMAFAPSTFAPLRTPPGSRPELAIYSFGLFGPNGPLPLHLTEFVREREHHHGDRTLAAFADLFHHRAITLFYRAWADAQPTVALDRPGNPFERYVGSLINLGEPTMRGRDSISDHARYGVAAHLVRQTRNPEGLVHILRQFFQVPVTLSEYVVQWIALEPSQCLALGAQPAATSAPDTRGLGRDSVVGLAVRDAQHRFRLQIGPLSRAEYAAFLPGRARARQLVDWVRQYIGQELAWDVRLVLKQAQAHGVALGAGPGAMPLGLASWLGDRPRVAGDADDLLIDFERRNDPTCEVNEAVPAGIPADHSPATHSADPHSFAPSPIHSNPV